MHDFQGLIFDMDGTLVDSEVVWGVAEAELFAERHIHYTDAVREQVIGLRLDEFFAKLITIYDLDETVERLTTELVHRMLHKIPTMVQPKSGAQALIEWANYQNIPYCIASSSPLSIIDATVEALGWTNLIPKRYSADVVAKGKPAPDVYLYAAKQIGVPPQACIAIEDSPNGAKSAVAAGLSCYVVPDSHSKPEAFATITPHLFDSLEDVLEKLSE